MQKLTSYTDIEFFLHNLTHKSNFKYNGINYGAMIGNDGNTIIKNFKSGVAVGKKQFLESISTSYEPQTIEVQKDTFTSTISNEDYIDCFITPKTLTDDFLKAMQLPFKDEYLNHPSIAYFDLDRLKSLHPSSKLFGKKNILFSFTDNFFNISLKYTPIQSWNALKGTKSSLGAFFKAKNKVSTLLLVEGLKDGINANITFENVDILVANGKSNFYNFEAHKVDLESYKNIIYANDKDNEEHLIKMFGVQHKAHYKKTRYLDWSKIRKGKDLTDIIEHIILPKHKTKRDRSRGALATLKKILHQESFENEYKKLRIKEATNTLNQAIQLDNKPMVMRAIKTLNMFNGSLLNGAKYYLKKQNETKTDNNLNIDLGFGRLAPHTDKIVHTLEKNSKVFLNAPTGTGKSYISLKELPKYYKNIIIVSPLRMVTNEHGANGTPYTNVQFNDNFAGVEADLNSNYIAITTDAFTKLKNRYKVAFSQRLGDANLVIFDEQHLYYDSLGFRDETVVKCYEYLLKTYNGKVLFMSGTPILPHDVEVGLITAKVEERAKKHINFYNNPFDSVDEIVESIKKDLEKGAVLLYSNSKNRVNEVEELLIENGVKTLSITSFDYKLDAKKVEDTILEEDLGNIFYIATTKATTGVNFKHLKAIYQYGTPYTPNTFIQLMARLRNGGKYFKIEPKYVQDMEVDNSKRAIGLIYAFQKLKVNKLSNAYLEEPFQKWLKGFVLLSHKHKTLKGFFNTYKKAFGLIESKGLGKFNQENDDFIFNGAGAKNIEPLFEFDDKNEFRKYIEQVLIDWILKNDAEMLNDYYNLSFKINLVDTKPSIETHHLITELRRETKKEDRKEDKEEIKELYKKLDERLKPLDITSKLLKKHQFSDSEISKLNDTKIHFTAIEKIKSYEDKLTALKFHLVPKEAILKVANAFILESDFLTIKELDSGLQKIFITNKRNKHPYEKLLIDLFTSEVFNDSYLQFNKTKRIDKKLYYNTLTISKEHKKHFEDLKSKKVKDAFLKNEMVKELERMRKENNQNFEIVIE